jgi:hypothetical protein
VALTLAAWGAVPWGAFQADDWRTVVRDPATTDLAALLERLATGFRPLLRLSYFLDARLWGLRPSGFLATNLLLHLATVLGINALASRRLGPLASFVAAVTFSLQPANAEVVAYVTGRSTGLMTALLVAALLAYEHDRWISSLSFFLLACLAKEVALVFPLLLLAWAATRGQAVDRRWIAAYAMVGVALGLALLVLSTRYRTLAAFSLSLRSPWEALRLNARVVPEALSLWLRPQSLSIRHAIDLSPHPLEEFVDALLLAIPAVTGTLLRIRRPVLALAFVWPVAALLPTNSLLARAEPISEKALYLAWLGPALFLGDACACALRRLHGIPALAAATAATMVLGLGGAFCRQRVAIWAGPRRLYWDAVTKTPGDDGAWNDFGFALLEGGEEEAAALAFRQALRLNPADAQARFNLYLMGRDVESP